MLRADYRTTTQHRKIRRRGKVVSLEIKVRAVRIQTSALKLMKGREKAPRFADTTVLPGGNNFGVFWQDCKSRRRCGRSPYDRLLINPVLRADYRATAAARATCNKFKGKSS